MCVAQRGLLAVVPAPVLARSKLLLLWSSPLARPMAAPSASYSPLVLARRSPSAAVSVVSQLCERLLLLLWRRRRPGGLRLGRIPLVLRRRLSLALDSAPSTSSLSPLLPPRTRANLSWLDSGRVTLTSDLSLSHYSSSR